VSQSDPRRWTPADHTMAAALAAGATKVRAAELAGVSPKTVHRRLHQPAFLALVNEIRTDNLGRVLDELVTGARHSVRLLARQVLDEDAPATVRQRAARSLLAAGPRWLNVVELDARLAEVEQALRDRQPHLRVIS
jgi:hypothetical protein